jgi:hypothetical protein
MMLNPIFELLSEEEQDELIRAGLACCGSYDSESGCCPFTHGKTVPIDEENE